MSDVDTILIPGESVAYRTGLHWIVFAPAVLVGSVLEVGGIGLLLAVLLKHPPGEHASVPLILLAVALMLVGSGWMAAGAIRWKATEITVTTRRVLIKTGILYRKTTEILLAKVESVSIEESVTARLFGFGKVTVHGTGGTPETFERIARPQEFRRQVQIQIEALRG